MPVQGTKKEERLRCAAFREAPPLALGQCPFYEKRRSVKMWIGAFHEKFFPLKGRLRLFWDLMGVACPSRAASRFVLPVFLKASRFILLSQVQRSPCAA